MRQVPGGDCWELGIPSPSLDPPHPPTAGRKAGPQAYNPKEANSAKATHLSGHGWPWPAKP